MVDGLTSRPFSAGTLPPVKISFETPSEDEVIKASRKRYARSKQAVEEEIFGWSGVMNTMTDFRSERPQPGVVNDPAKFVAPKLSLSSLAEENTEKKDFKDKPKNEGVDIDSFKAAILNKLNLSKHNEKKETENKNSNGVSETN